MCKMSEKDDMNEYYRERIEELIEGQSKSISLTLKQLNQLAKATNEFMINIMDTMKREHKEIQKGFNLITKEIDNNRQHIYKNVIRDSCKND